MLIEWAETKRSKLSKLVGFLSSKSFNERFVEVVAQLKDALGVLADVVVLRTAVKVAQSKWPGAAEQVAAVAADLQRLVDEVRDSSDDIKREVKVGAGRLMCSGRTQPKQPLAAPCCKFTC